MHSNTARSGAAPSQPSRLPSLTGLRALAAAMVFLVHVRGLQPEQSQATWAAVFGVGGSGVTFFFVLSGFVLTWAWSTAPSHRGAFYRRRAARILPNYLVTWFTGAVVTALTLAAVGGSLRASGLAFVVGTPLLQAWVPLRSVFHGINGPAWSLSVEAFFYLLFPLFIGLLVRTRAAIRLAVALSCVVLVIALPTAAHLLGLGPDLTEWAVFVLPIARVPEFVLGCALAAYVASGGRLRCPFPLTLAVALVALALAAWLGDPWTNAVVVVPFTIVIATAAQRDLDGQGSFAAHPWMVRLGEWSFAFYLVHEQVIRLLQLVPGPGTSLAAGLALGTLALALSLGAAALLYGWVERPLERRWRNGPARAPAASRRQIQDIAASGRVGPGLLPDDGPVQVGDPSRSRGDAGE